MTACKRASELISRSLDQPLNWRERLALAFHLCVCGVCRRFRRQMHLLQRAGRAAGGSESTGGDDAVTLGDEARERIRRTLSDQARGDAG